MAFRLGEAAITLSANMNPMLNALGRVGGLVSSAIAPVGLALGAASAAVVGFGTKAAAEMEQTEIAFETMLGSASKAKELLKDLDDFAASTPFQLPGITDAARQLLAFGVTQDQIVPSLRAIGDVASGINAPIGEIAEIYGKARVQGRLFMEDINQLTGRGIPVISELAKQFGVAESEVRKLVENGQVNFSNLQQVFVDLTSEGGRFAGLMEKQSQSALGLWSTLKDNLSLIARSIGEELLPVLKEALGFMLDNIPAIQAFTRSVVDGVKTALGWVSRFKAEFIAIKVLAQNLGLAFEIGFLTVAEKAAVAIDNVMHVFDVMWEYLKHTGDKLGRLYENVFWNILTVGKNVFTNLQTITTNFVNTWQTLWQNAWATVKNVATNIKTVFMAMFEAIRTRSIEPFQKLIFKGLSDGWKAVGSDITKGTIQITAGTRSLLEGVRKEFNSPEFANSEFTKAIKAALELAHSDLSNAFNMGTSGTGTDEDKSGEDTSGSSSSTKLNIEGGADGAGGSGSKSSRSRGIQFVGMADLFRQINQSVSGNDPAKSTADNTRKMADQAERQTREAEKTNKGVERVAQLLEQMQRQNSAARFGA